VEQAAHASIGPDAAIHPEHAPTYMANAVLNFNEQIERLGEVSLVVILGLLLARIPLPPEALWFTPLLFLAIRPASVFLTLLGSSTSASQRGLMGWFGIRGIGSLYYLFYALNHGVRGALAHQLVALVLTVVAVSIVVHGISVTPLMQLYERRHAKEGSTRG
jgi:sodium/hydrogen antiporter